MIRILSTLSLIFLSYILAYNQSDRFWTDNGFKLDADRYKNHMGSSYIFENFLLADITEYTGQVFEDIPINFNGFTQKFELKKDEQLYLLNEQKYLIVSIQKEKNPNSYTWGNESKIVFKRGFHPEFLEKFVQVIYDGYGIKLIRSIRQGLDEKVIQSVGEKIEIKRFNSQDQHYLIVDGESKKIDISEKDIKKALGRKKEIEEYINKNQLSMENPDDVIMLLEYLDSRG